LNIHKILPSRFAVRWVSLGIDLLVSSQAKPRPQRLILAGVVALAILLLLLRLFVFAHRHERHRFRGAATDPSAATVRAASYIRVTSWPSVPQTNRFAARTPDSPRLTDPATLGVQP
jgi:hypothetical protein